MKIAISGASGFVGTALRDTFENVVSLSREDFSRNRIKEKIKDCDLVINLAGAPIIKRWSESYKRELYNSRIDTTKALVEAMEGSQVKHFISASAVGFYPEDKACDEQKCPDPAEDFLAKICVDWEKEALKAPVDTAIVRFGIILDRNGGALEHMHLPFSLGIGGPIADGEAWFSWIDLQDLIKSIHHIADNRLTGTFNATAPHPVKNKDFTKIFGKVLHRPAFIPVPKFVLRLIFSEGAIVLTGSKQVYPKNLLESGFEFDYKTVEECLRKNYP